MPFPPSPDPPRHLDASDVQGLVRLATEATAGVTRIAEGVHQAVWATLGFPGGAAPGQARGLTGLVYASVRDAASLIGGGVDALLGYLRPLLDPARGSRPSSLQREGTLAALNGVVGDHLAATGNPLALPMSLRYQGAALNGGAPPPMPEATGKVLLLVHGLCMSELQWRGLHHGERVEGGGADSADVGEALASALGYTPVYLRYNTGLHTSENGRALAAELERTLARWPVPVEEIAVVAHSMGGLVTRSAAHYAEREGLRWRDRLRSVVFLGTPHHGAPLERARSWVDAALGLTPYTAPFARLGRLRSAGMTDLRYGNVLEEDWRGRHRLERSPDRRRVVPLPEGVACYAVAATAVEERSPLTDRLIGDGLVPLPSALGQHDDPGRRLAFASRSQRVLFRTGHLALLRSPAVARQLVEWLTPAG